MRFLLLFSLIISASVLIAQSAEDSAALLSRSRKLIVVTTAGWDDVNGTMTLYERKGNNWKPHGKPTEIVVGKNGMAWDQSTLQGLPGISASTPVVKREGDGRSPAGVFRIARTFGFAPKVSDNPFYLPLTPTTECVDDVNSRYYNQIVDRLKIKDVDWNSSEKMRQVAGYQVGAEVAYNAEHTPGRGSCIFLHIWSGAGKGTAGCTAMSEEDAKAIMRWLDEKTVLVQMPKSEYDLVRQRLALP